MTTTHPASDGAEKGPVSQTKPLSLLSVVIPARDEAGCIAATVEHLHLELRLHGIPHEIVVVDDGSSDQTWSILQSTAFSLNTKQTHQYP